jgi:glycerophosphoryl diester phosphodiesterase
MNRADCLFMSVLDIAMAVTNGIMAAIPRPMPERERLEQCRIVSHRGEHNNRDVMENTLTAFRIARDAGVWGIECDIRWTADLVPVISHDPSPARVFGHSLNIADLTFEELRDTLPEIPTLREVVNEFGGNTHLMLELKADCWPDVGGQNESLKETLEVLDHAKDYHLLTLDPALYQHIDFVPSSCFFPVAETNVSAISQFALENNCAGFAGHYLLLSSRAWAPHQENGQTIGTGFPSSENCFRREINRGVKWVFSNDAVKLEQLRQSYLQQL